MAPPTATTFLLPNAVRQRLMDVQTKMPQRKLDKFLLVCVLVGVLYCASLLVTPYRPHAYIHNVIMNHIPENPVSLEAVRESEEEAAEDPFATRAPAAAATGAPWRPGTTLRAAVGEDATNFRQPEKTRLVVREGGDIQLDCKVATQPHAIVTWYRGKDDFLTMGRRVYTDNEHISIHVDDDEHNWALRLHSVTLEDAGTYSCHMALSANDVITVDLDVLPLDEAATPAPVHRPDTLSKLFVSGYNATPAATVCGARGAGLSALVLVTSHPLYATHRDRIRAGWAAPEFIGDDVRVLFVFGYISAALSVAVDEEAARHGDLIVGSFHDVSVDPNVLTLRTLSGLQWVAEHCPQAKSVLVATHDQFVNVARLRSVVSKLSADSPTIWGRCDADTAVTRDPAQPDYVTYSEFQGARLPTFCRPPTYLMSRAALPLLTRRLPSEHALPLSHLLITGVAAERAGVRRVHQADIYKSPQRVETCEYDNYVSGDTWGKVIDMKVVKAILSGKTC